MPLSDADSARALDAWLKEHVGSAERQAAVRAVADRLEDLTGCEYDDLDEALELATWPALTRKRFITAWRRLKAGTVTSVTPDPPRAAPTRVAAPPPLPLSPASSAGATAESDDDAWEAGARELLQEVKDARERGSRDGLEGLRTTLTRHGFGMTRGGGFVHIAVPSTFPAASHRIRSLTDLARYLKCALGDDAKAPAWATAGPAASEYATTGDAELARRLAMGLPPRRASRGRAPSPPPAPPPPAASDDTDDDFDELYSEVAAAAAAPATAAADASSDDDDVPLSQWQAQAAAAQPAPGWAVGDKVEAKFCVKGGYGSRNRYSREFYPATITAVHGATVDVEYDTSDEETEEQLPVRHVRKRRRAAPSAASEPPAPPKKKTKKGARTKTSDPERSRLMALCLRRGIPCPGSGTSMEWMRQQLAAAGDGGDGDDLRVGGACFCRWGETWYGAKILSIDGDSYRVHFLGWGKRHDGTYPAEAVRPAR